MPATQETTIGERREMIRLAEEGHTYERVAEQVKVSYWTARKWIRIGKKEGVENLASWYGRPRAGPLGGYDRQIKYKVLRMKRKHPGWGAEYVLKRLKEDDGLKGKQLPSGMTIWRYWRSFGERLFEKREKPKSEIKRSEVPHGVWQMDAKESLQIPGVGMVSINQARDEYGRVTVMHQVHAEPKGGRQKAPMSSETAYEDCRIAFTKWGMPEAIQTDRDTIYVDSGKSPFPNKIVLWWVGLGIEHRLIPRRTPKRNGIVERSHRTLNERTLSGQEFASAAALQKQVDADWQELNHECPTRARGCNGKPPLEAHPEMLETKRPYRPEWELEIFDLKRVDTYLAEFTWIRTATMVGQVRMRNIRYSLGYAWAGQKVSVKYDPEKRQFVFRQIRSETRKGRSQSKLEPVRRDVNNLTVTLLQKGC